MLLKNHLPGVVHEAQKDRSADVFVHYTEQSFTPGVVADHFDPAQVREFRDVTLQVGDDLLLESRDVGIHRAPEPRILFAQQEDAVLASFGVTSESILGCIFRRFPDAFQIG